jgi:dolichol-phosphate mannosyltransferase
LRTFVGFRQEGVRYERAGREAGQSKFTARKLLRLAMDGLVGFSDFPLTLVSWFAGLGAVLTLGWLAWGLIALAWGAGVPAGWGLAVSLLFLGTIQAAGLAILSEYIRRIFFEIKGRPPYIARSSQAGPISSADELPQRSAA